MALARMYCGLAAAEMPSWLTVAVVDDAGRLLDLRHLSDDPIGYAHLGVLLGDRIGGSPVAVDRPDHLVTQLLAAANRPLAVADENGVADFAERFCDESSYDEMQAPAGQRRAVGLARALQAGAVHVTAQSPSVEFEEFKPVLAAHAAVTAGRQAAAVALREVLRELYPAALRAYPDPADYVPLKILEALPEPGLLTTPPSSRNRDAALVAQLSACGVADNATAAAAITALRVAVIESPRRNAHRLLASVVAETVSQAVAAVRACDAASAALLATLVERLTAMTTGHTARTGRLSAVAPVSPAPRRVAGPAAEVPPERLSRRANTASAAAAGLAAGAATGLAAGTAGLAAEAAGLAAEGVAQASPAMVAGVPAASSIPAPRPAPGPAPGSRANWPLVAPDGDDDLAVVYPHGPTGLPYDGPSAHAPSAHSPSSAHGPATHGPLAQGGQRPAGYGQGPSHHSQGPSGQGPAGYGQGPSRHGRSGYGPPGQAQGPSHHSQGPSSAHGPAATSAYAGGPPGPSNVPGDEAASSLSFSLDPLNAPLDDTPLEPTPLDPPQHGRVAPPWLALDMPAEPPSLRLVENAPHDPLTDSLGDRMAPPVLRVIDGEGAGRQRRAAIAEPPAASSDEQQDGDLLIFSEAARSAWFTNVDDGAEAEDKASWGRRADDGWRAAEQLARPAVGAETMAGLPRRVPQANLVPGSAPTPQRPLRIVRDAQSIAAHTEGYFRGWRRGQQIGGFAVGQRDRAAWEFNRDQRAAREEIDQQRARLP